MLNGIAWFFQNIGLAYINILYALTHPAQWLDWSNREAMGRFVYYGASVEFFFVIFTTFLTITVIGLFVSGFLWRLVRGLEAFHNGLGRIVAWAGLIMVLQQIVIIFLQRVFRVASIEFGPFAPFGYQLLPGPAFVRDLSWWSEELKLYNAMIVCLCVTYTFVQGGHVRVDLVYSNVRFRVKKAIDMFGSVFFMMLGSTLTWLFAWHFMWRSLVTPKVSASETLEMILRKAKIMRWNVETIGFSPNGFDAYFLFKFLMLAFCGLVFLQGCTFFWRSLLEFREGPASEGKYIDRDPPGDSTTELQTH